MGVQKSKKNTRFFRAKLTKYSLIHETYRKNKVCVDFLFAKHKHKKSNLFKLVNEKAVKPLFFEN